MPVMTEQARAWAASGAMALTGRPDGPPLVAPDGVVDRIRGLGASLGVDPLALLGERAALSGLRRGGAVSCGGNARLLRASDGWVAVSLARDDDVAAVPAWLGLATGDLGNPWPVVVDAVACLPREVVLERGALLGLPVAVVPEGTGMTGPGMPVQADRIAGQGARSVRTAPLVVDLSALWAGPLCSRLLSERGARVVKIESVTRPDAARAGPREFFDLFHHGHEMVALDWVDEGEVACLERLLERADVVIEASRPRALEQLGVDVTALVQRRPTVWVSITGYGRRGPARNRVAFGDDAAAGGGLVARDAAGPCFVADAVADPLSGVAAAAAVTTALHAGGSWMLDVAMARVAAYVAGDACGIAWQPGADADAVQPRAPTPARPAPAFGAHTRTVLAELA